MKYIGCLMLGLWMVGVAHAAVYDIGTAGDFTFHAGDSLINTTGITDWTDAESKIAEGSDLSNVDFTALGIQSWTTTFGTSAVTIWDGANLSGITLSLSGHNNFFNDSFDGTDFSGATIVTAGNQPFVSTGGLSLNHVNFSGATFYPGYSGSFAFVDYSGANPRILAGADFSDTVWESAVTQNGKAFNVGPGSTSVADKHLAADFSGADFSKLTGAGTQAAIIAALGKKVGGTAIGAKYNQETLDNSGWTAAELNAAGWQQLDAGVPRINNLDGASQVLGEVATLSGSLTSMGDAPAQVWVCWGETDAGTERSAWDHSNDMGWPAIGDFSLTVTNLTSDTDYGYRCVASNEYGVSWTDVQYFTPSIPRITVDLPQIVEDDSGLTLAVFTVRLSRAYPEAVLFSFSTVDGVASASTDYEAQGGERTFFPGQTEMQISITIYEEALVGGDKDFFLQLENSDTAVLENDRGAVVIFSDEREAYLSPSVLVADPVGNLLYVAESSARRIGIIDGATDAPLLNQIDLPQHPTGLALSADGATLYVTAGVATGEVYVVDTASRQITQTIQVGHSPLAPVLTADNALYVCERFLNTVARIDLATGYVADRIAVVREPHGAALTPDGAKLVVANLLPHQPSTADGVAASVSIIDTTTGLVTANIVLPPGSHSLRDVAISPDGSVAVVAHTLGRYRIAPSQYARGWANTSAMSLIDLASETLYNTVDIDDLDEGAANPWGLGFTADGGTLCIAHAGTHELSAIDWAGLLTKLGTATENVCDDLTYLAGLRRRLPLPGNGPRGLAIIGSKAYTANYFSDSLSVVNLTEGQEYAAQEILIGWEKPQTDVRLGNQYFFDGKLSAQQWQSCSSCHPDVRADGLNWDELNDGFGNPKNVKSLLNAHYTAPTTITGVRPNAETSVLAGLRYSHFRNVHNGENLLIDAFLKAEQPVPSPYLVDGALSDAAVRGKVSFEARCATCHNGPYLTDQQLHHVGTATDLEAGPFDTPSLIEAWRTAPYLHDGRAQTLHDVVEVFHERSAGLTDEEIDDLVEYINSL